MNIQITTCTRFLYNLHESTFFDWTALMDRKLVQQIPGKQKHTLEPRQVLLGKKMVFTRLKMTLEVLILPFVKFIESQ